MGIVQTVVGTNAVAPAFNSDAHLRITKVQIGYDPSVALYDADATLTNLKSASTQRVTLTLPNDIVIYKSGGISQLDFVDTSVDSVTGNAYVAREIGVWVTPTGGSEILLWVWANSSGTLFTKIRTAEASFSIRHETTGNAITNLTVQHTTPNRANDTEARAGTNNDKYITPLTSHAVVDELVFPTSEKATLDQLSDRNLNLKITPGRFLLSQSGVQAWTNIPNGVQSDETILLEVVKFGTNLFRPNYYYY